MPDKPEYTPQDYKIDCMILDAIEEASMGAHSICVINDKAYVKACALIEETIRLETDPNSDLAKSLKAMLALIPKLAEAKKIFGKEMLEILKLAKKRAKAEELSMTNIVDWFKTYRQRN